MPSLSNKKGQVWMETLLYTVVSIAILGVVLSFALPKLEQNKERALIAMHISTLKTLDALVLNLANAPAGNSRAYSLQLERGTFVIDGTANKLLFTIPEVGVKYSEVGVTIHDGSVSVLTSAAGKKKYTITLSTSYDSLGLDLVADQKDSALEFTQAPTPYTLQITREQRLRLDETSGKNVIEPYITISEQKKQMN